MDPASVKPGEKVVLPMGKPTRQCFARLKARVQLRRESRDKEFIALFDQGAEAGMMSLAEARVPSPEGMCPLKKGDHSVIELADDHTQVQIQGVVHLTLRFGNKLVRHKFYVVDLPITTILGSDFFGMYQTLFDYKDLTYQPLGAEGPKLKMMDKDACATRTVWQ